MERNKRWQFGIDAWNAVRLGMVAGSAVMLLAAHRSDAQDKMPPVSPSDRSRAARSASTKSGGAPPGQMKAQSEIPIENQRLIPATKPIELTGEVVDAWCYTSQVMGPGRGEKHKACALACAHGGVTLGILDEKTNELFIAAKYRGYTGCKELLLPFVAKRVKVKGWVARKGGCTLLKIKSVELLK